MLQESKSLKIPVWSLETSKYLKFDIRSAEGLIYLFIIYFIYQLHLSNCLYIMFMNWHPF